MKNRKYDAAYIDKISQQIERILNAQSDTSEWSQIGLSIKNAVQAASAIWGSTSDDQKHAISGFVKELVLMEISNIREYNITYQKK